MAIDRFLSLIDSLEAAYRPRIAAALGEHMLTISASFRLTHLPAPDPASALQGMNALLRSMWAQAIEEGAALFLSVYSEGFPAATKSTNTTGLLDAFVSGLRPNLAQQLLTTSRSQIRDMMRGGLTAGQSADEVYLSLLEKIPAMADLRGLLISRTEVHAATQYAALRMAQKSTIPLVKVWNSVQDDRTRDFGELGKISQFNHRSMDGAREKLSESFLVPRIIGGYEPLMFPGDPLGSAGNIINCRCIQTYERAE